MRKLVGLLGAYRRQIPNFSKVAKPTYDLFSVTDKKITLFRPVRTTTIQNACPVGERKSKCLWIFTWTHYVTPIIAYLNYNDPFIVHTDASQMVLESCSTRGNAESFASSPVLFTLAERNYHLHLGKLEFLALKWVVSQQFRDYLYYVPSSWFILITTRWQTC